MVAAAVQEKLTPDFAIRVDGADLTRKLRQDLLSLSIDLEINKVDECTLKLRNDDFRWSDGKEFKDGTAVEVDLGYVGGEKHKLFSGEVVVVKASFPRRGPCTVVVVIHSLLHRLRRCKKSETFGKVRDSEIVTKIAQKYGMTPEIEKSATKNEFLFQNNQTDLDFLLERARRVGMELVAEGKKLIYRKPRHDKPKLSELTWNENLRTFDVRQQVQDQKTSFQLRGWDPIKKQPIVFKRKAGDESSKMGGKDLGTEVTQQVFGEVPNLMLDQAVASVEEAEAWAKGMWEQAAMDFLTGEGSCQGDGKLKPGNVVELKGLGGDYDGNYYLSRTRHVIGGGGYSTVFECKRSAIGEAPVEQEPLTGKPVPPTDRQLEEHWIEKTFVDATGKPLKDLEYSWTLTGEGAEPKSGTLGADGTLKARGIDPGTAHAVLKEITACAWQRPRADVGKPIGLFIKVTGFENDTPVEFAIAEKSNPDKVLHTVTSKVDNGTARGVWTYEWNENDGVKSFQFMFKAKVGSRERESNVLEMYETVEVEGKDDRGQPLRDQPFVLIFADGRAHAGYTNMQGKGRITGIRPGKHEIYFPSGDHDEAWK